jgi:hypothetical protein
MKRDLALVSLKNKAKPRRASNHPENYSGNKTERECRGQNIQSQAIFHGNLLWNSILGIGRSVPARSLTVQQTRATTPSPPSRIPQKRCGAKQILGIFIADAKENSSFATGLLPPRHRIY